MLLDLRLPVRPADRPRTGRRSPAPRAPACRTSRRSAARPSATADPHRPAACGHRNVGDLVVAAATISGSLPTPGVSAARISPEYEVRRHVVSMARWKCRTPRPSAAPGRLAPDAGAIDRLLEHRPAGGLPLPKQRQRVVVGDPFRIAAVGHRGLPGSPAPQQPRQPAVGFVLRRRPPRHHLRLRPGHRDIGQPAVVAGGFSAGPASATVAKSGLSVPPTCRQRTASSWNSTRSSVRTCAVERERQVHDRELQPLAHPHRHDLHGGGVAVEAAVAFGCAAALVALARAASPATPAGCNCSRCATSCSSCVMCARSVMWRSPPCHDKHPSAHPGQLCGLEDRGDARAPARDPPTPAASPRPRRSASSPPAARSSAVLPKNIVAAAARTMPGRCGWSNASSRHSQSSAASETEHVGVAGVHRGDPRPPSSASKQARASSWLSTITATSRACSGLPSNVAPCGQQRADVGGQVGGDVRPQVVHRDGSGTAAAEALLGGPPAAGTGRCAVRRPAGGRGDGPRRRGRRCPGRRVRRRRSTVCSRSHQRARRCAS